LVEFGETMRPDDNIAPKFTFVNFLSGSCGEFLISLIILMHNKYRDDYISVSDEGSCHSNRKSEPEIINSWTPEYLDKFMFNNAYKSPAELENLIIDKENGKRYGRDKEHQNQIKNIISPVCKSHLEIKEIPKLILHYSNTSVINIIPDDADQVARNVIFKTLLPKRERTMFGGNDLVELLTILGLPITNDILSLTINEFDQVYNIIKSRHAELEIAKLDKFKAQLHWIFQKSSYHEITLSEIMSNKKSLFIKLNNITGLPITKEAINFYSTYIEKQPTLSDLNELKSKLKQD